MRRLLLTAPLLALLALAPTASGAVPHTVAPGETLWSIALQTNLTTRALAVFNGISPDARVIAGQTVRVPSVAEAATAMSAAGIVPGSAVVSGASVAPAASGAAPAALGAYTVHWGDTLSAIALRAGVPAAQIAAMNGLNLAGILLTGTALKLPTGAAQGAGTPGGSSTAASSSSAAVVPRVAPYPTPVHLDAGTIGQIASAQGVPAGLASAIAWQESGFNNAAVSGANARGVMQLLPGTWDYVQRYLAGGRLDPASAADNVRAGSLYIASLLRQTGGQIPTAVAGYYQGLSSVRSSGMYPDTRRYVSDVLALRGRFGG